MKLHTIQGTLLGVLIGIAVGIGLYTFAYAKGWSYLTDNPAACANCHVMREQFDGWLKSSHRAVASCNSCLGIVGQLNHAIKRIAITLRPGPLVRSADNFTMVFGRRNQGNPDKLNVSRHEKNASTMFALLVVAVLTIPAIWLRLHIKWYREDMQVKGAKKNEII